MSASDFQRAKEILLKALDLDVEFRAELLDRECVGNEALRSEVESLLGQDERPARIVEEGLLNTTAGQQVGAAMEELQRRQMPKQLGPYEILGLLGEGGMGVVYRARQHEPIERDLAIKVIRRGMDTDRVLARFKWERKSLARMDHPNIASIIDAGADEHGRPFVVMQLADGAPITVYCDEQRMPLKARVRLFLLVCRAVQHAHDRGVLHRDLKPSNLLVRNVDGHPAPMIIDFGIAKALDPDDDSTELTLDGQRIGTPAYMSPEQLRGEVSSVDIRSDVYALGVILYELMAGRRPFDESSAGARSGGVTLTPSATLNAPSTGVNANDDIEAMAQRRATSVRRLRRELGGDLDTICLMAVRPEAERRYASVAHLIEDLERYLDGRPVLARPDSFSYRASKFGQRHPAKVGVGFALLLMIIAASVGLGIFTHRVQVERDRALAAETIASEEAAAAMEIANFLEGLFIDASPGSGGVSDLTARELLDQGANRLATELGDQPVLLGRMSELVGRVYHALGLYDRAESLATDAMLALESVAVRESSDELLLGQANSLMGLVLHDKGDWIAAEVKSRRAIAAYDRAHPGPSELKALEYGHLAVDIQGQGRLAEATEWLQRSLAAYAELGIGETVDTAWVSDLLGYVKFKQGDYLGARDAVEAANEILERVIEGDHLDMAHSLNSVGNIHALFGDFERAELELENALSMYRRMFEGDHPAVARAIINLGRCLAKEGRLDEGLRLLNEGHAMNLRTLGLDHPKAINSSRQLAGVWSQLGRDDEAEAALRDALLRHAELLGESHLFTLASREALGQHLLQVGRSEEALEHLETVHALRFESLSEGHPLIYLSAVDLADAQIRSGQSDGARELLEAAVSQLEAVFGKEDPRPLRARGLLAELPTQN